MARKPKVEPLVAGIYVGSTGNSIETTKSLTATILQIITKPVSDNVKLAALESLTQLCKTGDTRVENCAFNVDQGGKSAINDN
jgi:hypothetical protein